MPEYIVFQLLLLSFLLGFFSVSVWQMRRVRPILQWIWSVKSTILWLMFGVFIVSLMIANWSFFVSVPSNGINDFTAVQKMLLKNPANLKLIMIGGFLALAGLLSVVLRLPFMRWEQLKLLGFEAKRAAEQAKSTAKEELEREVKLSMLRMTYVQHISSRKFYDEVMSRIEEGATEGIPAVKFIEMYLTILAKSFRDIMQIEIETGAVPVENGELDHEYLDDLSEHLKECIRYAYRYDTDKAHDDGIRSTRVVKVHASSEEDYFLIYLHSTSHAFHDSDLSIIATIDNVLSMHLQLGGIEVIEEDVA